jgi:hypothetical protein
MGSSPDEVIGNFINLRNSYTRTMALGFSQPVTETSTRRSFWSRARSARKADVLTAVCDTTV